MFLMVDIWSFWYLWSGLFCCWHELLQYTSWVLKKESVAKNISHKVYCLKSVLFKTKSSEIDLDPSPVYLYLPRVPETFQRNFNIDLTHIQPFLLCWMLKIMMIFKRPYNIQCIMTFKTFYQHCVIQQFIHVMVCWLCCICDAIWPDG